ncbi:MAG TPA: nuclear transport factor 2 family protein [Rhodothermales bacterium]|nr:nuclear transport factor 2 family protein [Rhodothermales bacterium]
MRLLVALFVLLAPLAVRAQSHDHAAHDSTHHDGMDHGAMHAMHHPDTFGAAETEDHEAVRAAVVALFDAMRAGDADALLAVVHPGAVLMSVAAGRDGVTHVETETMDNFAAAVGAPHDQVYDERIGPIEVRVDGPLATAWTVYKFYVGPTFSHCGVDAFQFANTGDGWKIIAVTDTRRTECEGFPEVVGAR